MHKQLLENRMMKNNNRTVALNMIANVLSFGVSLIISFFLTPYITKNVGTEAYGLVGLANSFINYINVITAALNSMASRFIIIELHKKNTKKANIYYSSVLIANTIFAFVLLLPAIWLIINIKILNISPDFLFDARMTFSIIFINFIVSLLGAFLGIVLYAKNILWKGSFRTLESNILRVFLIVVFFYPVWNKNILRSIGNFGLRTVLLCFQLLLYKKIYTRTKSKEEIFFFFRN